MITLRRAEQRHLEAVRKRMVWLTFNRQDPADRLGGGFGALEMLNEERLPPGAVSPPGARPIADVITYVREGTLTCVESEGGEGLITAGEFQRQTAGPSARPGLVNASRKDWAQVFEIWLAHATNGFETSREQKRFSMADRRNRLCLVASTNAWRDSLRLQADARVYSAILDPGHHIVHPLDPERRAWIHIVEGEVAMGDVTLATGDGAGISTEPAVSFTALEDTEVLLTDLGAYPTTKP